ncbi:LapA family protein [Solihabitans fulvus]|uniref:LapA family protein n=1 Tax=Solihabitans fulvus TaxID=1892852 RepID=A0A5B2X308_9PSEU|nr:LapA family protein [Solihabitans fulvus]KAA2257560.1 LapA family protein [Solihabitans fulvus]
MTVAQESAPRKSGIRGWLGAISARQWAAIVIFAAAVTFVLQNYENASVHVFMLTVTMPIWLLLTIALAVGVLIGTLMHRRS